MDPRMGGTKLMFLFLSLKPINKNNKKTINILKPPSLNQDLTHKVVWHLLSKMYLIIFPFSKIFFARILIQMQVRINEWNFL